MALVSKWEEVLADARLHEVDPSGKTANEPGAKLDDGKLRPRLVLGGFVRALEEVIRVGTAGANKYTDNGWQSVPDGRARYANAADRHQIAIDKGYVFDETMDRYVIGGRVRHKAQVIWNKLAELELELREEE